MALDIITGVDVSPRGGLVGTAVTATGTGFGVATGKVIFDPLNQALEATVTLWQDDQVDFTVPAGLLVDNQFIRITIQRADLTDSDTIPFWLPDSTLTNLGPLPAALDYQWPNFEEGTDENTDDPRTATASDFNRTLDRLRFVEGATVSKWKEPVSVIRYIGNDTVANLNTAAGGFGASEAGRAFVVTDAGTLSAGTVTVTAGDVVEWGGSAWVLVIDTAAGFPPVGTRLVASTTGGDTLQSPLANTVDDGKIAQFDGNSLSPAQLISPDDGCAVLVVGEGSEFENGAFVYDGSVPTGTWNQFSGGGGGPAAPIDELILDIANQDARLRRTAPGEFTADDNAGGSITFKSADAAGASPAGSFTIQGGAGSPAGGAPAPLIFTAGASGAGANDTGGAVQFTSGAGDGSAGGGDISFGVGASGASADGGNISFTAASAGATGVTGGSLTFTAGSSGLGGGQTGGSITNRYGGGTITGTFTVEDPGGNAVIEASGLTTANRVAVRHNGADALVVDTNGVSAPGVGTNSERWGSGATASADGTTSVGSGAIASDTDCTAVGRLALASQANGTAIGANSDATGANNCTAVGESAQATDNAATAVGQSSLASGAASTCVGRNSEASALRATAVGTDTVAGHSQTVVLGANAASTGTMQLVVGSALCELADVYLGGNGISDDAPNEIRYHGTRTNTTETNVSGSDVDWATGEGTGSAAGSVFRIRTPTPTASGTAQQALATRFTASSDGVSAPGAGTDSEAWGDEATAAGDQSVALGERASAGGLNSVSIGQLSAADSTGATAVGRASSASESSVALGNSAAAGGTDSNTAIGANATASGTTNSTAVGRLSTASISNSVAVGSLATASGSGSLALGPNASATMTNTVAVGSSSSATGGASTVVGAAASDGGNTDSTVFGASAATTGTVSCAIGRSSRAAASGTALGDTARSEHTASICIGRDATSTASNQFVVGSSTAPINHVFIGREVSGGGTSNVIFQSSRTSTSVTDGDGSVLDLVAGEGTGAGAESTLTIQTSNPTGSGTTQHTLTIRATFGQTAITLGSSDDETITLGTTTTAAVGFHGMTSVLSAAYARNATVVEDRTLLASASATVTNNNNVLAALIADLQAKGVIG